MKSKFFQNYMKQFDDMPKAFRKSKYIFVYLMVSLAIVNFIVFYVAVNLNSIYSPFKNLSDMMKTTSNSMFGRWEISRACSKNLRFRILP